MERTPLYLRKSELISHAIDMGNECIKNEENDQLETSQSHAIEQQHVLHPNESKPQNVVGCDTAIVLEENVANTASKKKAVSNVSKMFRKSKCSGP